MAPVRTTVLPFSPAPSTAAVSVMVSVPWVITMRFSATAWHRSRMRRRPASVICRLSIIMRLSISTSSRQRPRRSMSPVCVLWKYNSPVSSLYSLSEVPPVTRMRMGCMVASSASIARYIGVIPMRGMRWLLLVAIAAILGGVVYQYRAQKRLLARNVPVAPAPLSMDLSASSQHWHYRDKDLKTGRVKSDIDAESMQQVKDASRVDLKNVTMMIYGKDGKTYDLVKSAAAAFNTEAKSLYSEGDVEITLNLPVDGQAAKQPTVIKTLGLTCDSDTGRVDTDQPSSFVFEKGDGKATGATYDPASHELLMKSAVEIHWNPPGTHAKPMKIEAATLAWHETTSEIWLKPWGRMTRENTVVEGNEVVVKLEDKVIRRITAIQAHGNDDYPNRKLHYAADELAMDFDDDGLARKINGNRNASLISTTDASETTVTADRVDLDFEPDGRESVLTRSTR